MAINPINGQVRCLKFHKMSLLGLPNELLVECWTYLTHQERLRTRLLCHRLASIGGEAIETLPWHCQNSDFTVPLSQAFPRLHTFLNVCGKVGLKRLLMVLGERKSSVHTIGLPSWNDRPQKCPTGLLSQFINLILAQFARARSCFFKRWDQS